MNWHDSFTTPTIDQDAKNDFFHVIPPTPFGVEHAFAQSIPNGDLTAHAHHLRPTSLRSHRSSSHASISSSVSAFSSNTQWGSESDYADPAQSFHVDPKLFQAKESNEEEEEKVEAVQPEKKKARKTKTAAEKADRKKVSHARKQHPEHIPRPRNAFILFRKHVVDSKLIPTSVEIRHQNVSIITAKMWSEASAEQKAHFNELARIEKEEHMKKYPGYRYQPVYRRTNVIRRRVRKDEAEEEKCKNVAQLLMEGKTGEELAEEIRETESGHKKVVKGVRAPSKKGQANELSKGALRALRAQSRQTGDWSDASRSVSRAVSPELDTAECDSPQVETSYMTGPVLVPDVYAQPQPTWGYQQPMTQDYSQAQSFNPAPETYTGQTPYFAYDQALPFSPRAAGFQIHSQPGVMGMRQGVQDMVFPSFPEGLQSPSGQLPPGPFSARWDGRFDANFDPTGQTSFDMSGHAGLDAGLDFGGQDMMLHDFGAALAQADDMGVW